MNCQLTLYPIGIATSARGDDFFEGGQGGEVEMILKDRTDPHFTETTN